MPRTAAVLPTATLLVLEEQPGASISDVARAVASTRQSANELVAGMERLDLVERRPHPQDRRSQELRLTSTERARLAAARPVVHAAEQALERDLGADTRAGARVWLTRIAAAGHTP